MADLTAFTIAKLDDLEPDFGRRLRRLILAAPGSVTVFSGRRSAKRQAELWAEALRKYGSVAAARKWVAPPGSSKHERGEAADLRYGAGMREWCHNNAARYGLAYRLDNEPWHIESTGKPTPTPPVTTGDLDMTEDEVRTIVAEEVQAALKAFYKTLVEGSPTHPYNLRRITQAVVPEQGK